MKHLLLLFILIYSADSYQNLKPIKNSDVVTAKAFESAIYACFTHFNITFDILIVGKKDSAIDDKVNEIRKRHSTIVTRIKRVEKIKKNLFRRSAIIFGNNGILSLFHNHARLAYRHPQELRFLICTTSLKEFQLDQSIFYKHGKIKNHNPIKLFTFFLHENDKKIDYLTYEWFTDKACNKKQKNILNSFNKKTKKWMRPFDLSYKKFRHFHGCEIVAMQSYECYTDKFGKVQGKTFDVLDVVGSAANFTVYRQPGHLIKKNLTIDAHNNLKRKPQVVVAMRVSLTLRIHSTAAIDTRFYTMMITRGEPFSPWEKLLLPFDRTTWWMLATTFGIAFCVILLVNRASKKLQIVIYGRAVTTPAYNVVGTFFGVSQSRLPQTNFPRMVLMFFILFCLVVRTAYQGVFFELMATDMRKPVPTTFEDLIDENYTIYGFKSIMTGFFKKTILQG
jgi:hypothetical protein